MAQVLSEKDSLEQILPNVIDVQKADVLNSLALCLRNSDTAKAGNYARQAYALSNQLNYCKGKASSDVILGILHKNGGNTNAAKQHYLSGLSLALKCKEPISVSFAYHSLGNLAYLNGEYDKAMRFYIASVKISEQIGDKLRAARTFNNIGSLYMELNNPAQAELYYLRSLEFYSISQDELMIAEIETNLANIYQKRGQELQALSYYSKALEVFRRNNNATDISSALNNIGLIFLSQKKANRALPFFWEAYKIDMQLMEPKSVILAYANLSSTYLALNKFDSALYFANKGFEIAKKNPRLTELSDIYSVNAEVYLRLKDKAKATYFLNLKRISDQTIISKEQKKEIGIVATEFENERKSLQLKTLLREKEIYRLKIKQQQSVIERRSLLLIITCVIIFFLLSVTFLVIFILNLSKKNKLFEMSNKAKSDLLQQINHEIRTPLTGIAGISELASESKTIEELNEYLSYIKLSTDELMLVLNNLIIHLQLDRKEAHAAHSAFNLPEALQGLFKIYHTLCKEKGIVFKPILHGGLPEIVSSDSYKLLNMVQNLLSNAVKNCDKGNVTIEVKKVSERSLHNKVLNRIQISVSDEGAGMNEKGIKHVFKGPPRVRDGEIGFGIGLKNVKELIDLLKGNIEVSSELGKGSTFILEIELEVNNSKKEKSNLGSDRKIINEPGKYRILLAEDNRINQYLISKILEQTGFQFRIAENGLKTLSLLKEKTYDLILMNIQLPEMDGIETTFRIRNREEFAADSKIPILGLSANNDISEKLKCFEVGMNDYLTKPINKDLLISKIEQLLSS